MNRMLFLFVLFLVLGVPAAAEVFELEVKPLPYPDRNDPEASLTLFDRLRFRPLYSTGVIIVPGGSKHKVYVPFGGEAEYTEIVDKEPALTSEKPLRGVFTLGGRPLPFILDASGTLKKGYDRLFVDLDGDGDLSDEEVIRSRAPKEPERKGGLWPKPDMGLAHRVFTPISVTLGEGEAAYSYAFTFQSDTWEMNGGLQTWCAIFPALYRAGEITVDGVTRKVALFDHNVNGRFDDIHRKVETGEGNPPAILPGDIMLFGPDREPLDPVRNLRGVAENRFAVAKTVRLDEALWSLAVTPSGNRMTLDPSPLPTGKLATFREGSILHLFNERIGVLVYRGGGSVIPTMPAGEWWLMEGVLFADFQASDRHANRISASSGLEGPRVTVREGRTAVLPFGPPYRGEVRWTERKPRTPERRIRASAGIRDHGRRRRGGGRYHDRGTFRTRPGAGHPERRRRDRGPGTIRQRVRGLVRVLVASTREPRGALLREGDSSAGPLRGGSSTRDRDPPGRAHERTGESDAMNPARRAAGIGRAAPRGITA